MKILVVGKGGREHSLLKALALSETKPSLYSWAGSSPISEIAEVVKAEDLPSLAEWMMLEGIDLCIAGEETCLVEGVGLAKLCEQVGIPCFAPPKESAQLEASKAFAKEFLKRNEIPTASSVLCSDMMSSWEAIGNAYPKVLKFDGLAAGKGVAVCQNKKEAEDFLFRVFEKKEFGKGHLLVEDFLEGVEISIFAVLSDGEYFLFPPARDYKRLQDGDKGPNTGGMGAISAKALLSDEELKQIEEEIVQATIKGLIKDGLQYRGFLYFGLMLTSEGAKVIEFNCRFGDPECQVVLPLISGGDFAKFCLQVAKGDLPKKALSFSNDWQVGIVLAAKGYPENPELGAEISGLKEIPSEAICYAGVALKKGKIWQVNGGRVLIVLGRGASRQEAVERANVLAEKIQFSGCQRRQDIGILHCKK